MAARDSERMTQMIQKIVASKDFGSLEEMQEFMRTHVVGKTIEELEAMLPDDVPQNDLERAERLMDGIPEDAASEEVVRIAQQALALSESCMEAWLEIGIHEQDAATALEMLEKGIGRGRVLFETQIKQSGEGHGIWGYIEARDFMRLLNEKAVALMELGKLEQAMDVYQEMLALNPSDNQGIRGSLLRIFIIYRRLDDARRLLDRFPNDTMVDMAYGRALLEMLETLERTGFEIPDPNSPEAPANAAAFLKGLGPEFAAGIKLLNHAVKLNPFVAIFMHHGSIVDVEVDDDYVCFGGPYEAVVYIQQWSLIWYVSGLPFLLLNGAVPKNLKNIVNRSHFEEELTDVMVQLEELDEVGGSPWWEKFEVD